MSLKIFHFVFITLSSLLCMGLGLWAFRAFSEQQVISNMFLGVGSFIAAGALIYYGNKFYQTVIKDPVVS